MDAARLFHVAWPYLVVAAPGLFAVWKLWRDGRRAARQDRIDLIKIAQEVSGEAIEDLRQEAADRKAELAELKREFADFRRMHDSMIADKDAELALLRGENRQLKALAEAYERLLEANGIPHEKPTQPFWRVDAGSYPTELAR